MVVEVAASARRDPASDQNDETRVLNAIAALTAQLDPDNHVAAALDSRLSDDLSLDSLAIVELCERLAGLFDVTVNDDALLNATTPRDLLAALHAARGQEPDVVRPSDIHISTVVQVSVASVRDLDPRRARRSRRGPRARVHPRPRYFAQSIRQSYAWLVVCPFAVAIVLLAVLPLRPTLRNHFARRCGRFTRRRLRIDVVTSGDLPVEGPIVIVANHSSFIDGLVLFVTIDDAVTFVSSVELERRLLLGLILRRFDCRFVERGRPNRGASSVGELVEALRKGQRLVVFPEGSLDDRIGLRPFHLGAFEAAAAVHCPVIPLGIRGSRDVLPVGSLTPRSGRVTVSIGAPLVSSGADFTARVTLRDSARAAVSELCGDSAIR